MIFMDHSNKEIFSMKKSVILISSLFFLLGCMTEEVGPGAEPQTNQPAKIRVGMPESEVLNILGKPTRKTSVTQDNGEVIEVWFYRRFVREWQEIQHTDFETVPRINLITGEIEQEVVPVESTVTRSLYQRITVKVKNGQVIELSSRMDEDLEDVLD